MTELRAVAGSDWVFVDQTASPGLQIDDTTSATLSYSAPRCSRNRRRSRRSVRIWPSNARGESNSIWSNPEYHSNRPPTYRCHSTKGSPLRHPS